MQCRKMFLDFHKPTGNVGLWKSNYLSTAIFQMLSLSHDNFWSKVVLLLNFDYDFNPILNLYSKTNPNITANTNHNLNVKGTAVVNHILPLTFIYPWPFLIGQIFKALKVLVACDWSISTVV